MEKIAVIATNYENYTVTQEFIDSFEGQTSKNYKIFIADNSEKRRQFKKQENLVILPGKNRGFASGVNRCLLRAKAEGFSYFMVIGNDTEVSDNLIEQAIKSLKQHPNSIIGGKIYYYPNFEFHKEKYSKNEIGRVIWYAGGSIDWKNMFISHRGVDNVDHGQYDQFEQTDFVTGCLMCFDKSVLDTVGNWDEAYFLYFEDTDFSERAKRRGASLYYDPTLIIWHKNAQSSGGSGSNLQKKYQEKGRLRFAIKYAPLRTTVHLIKNLFLKR